MNTGAFRDYAKSAYENAKNASDNFDYCHHQDRFKAPIIYEDV
jgi:hypothetical protein